MLLWYFNEMGFTFCARICAWVALAGDLEALGFLRRHHCPWDG